jgi:hypothetical protein
MLEVAFRLVIHTTFYATWSGSRVPTTPDFEYESGISICGKGVIQRRCESPPNPEAISDFTALTVYRFFFGP